MQNQGRFCAWVLSREVIPSGLCLCGTHVFLSVLGLHLEIQLQEDQTLISMSISSTVGTQETFAAGADASVGLEQKQQRERTQ